MIKYNDNMNDVDFSIKYLPRNPNCATYYGKARRPWQPGEQHVSVCAGRITYECSLYRCKNIVWSELHEYYIIRIFGSDFRLNLTHHKSAALDPTNIHLSSSLLSCSTTLWMALPTRPEPPVTRMIFMLCQMWSISL